MKLSNTFGLHASIEEAWPLLNDVERLAPLMPGVQLTASNGNDHHGVLKVKIGPVVAQYDAVATYVKRDESAHSVVVRATGRDSRGQGNFSADVVCRLSPQNGGTQITVDTDLNITGKAAQFGHRLIEDVSIKLLDAFVANVSRYLEKGPVSASPERQQSQPLDLGALAGPVVLKRLIAPILGAAMATIAILLIRRSRVLQSKGDTECPQSRRSAVTPRFHSIR